MVHSAESATFCLKCDMVVPQSCVARFMTCALFSRVILAMKNFFRYPLDGRSEDMIQFAQPLSEKGKVLRR